ncbi:MAG: hypothetical protein HOV80_05735, partial [Polyangiaceae bacterium]|nr:hypothetical protein [Polyangiaceae bacterium]
GGTSGTGGTGGMPGTGGGAETNAVTVMTWNLEHFPKTSAAVGAAQTIIGSKQPDIIGLQELNADSDAGFEQLLAAVPGYDGYQAFYGDGFVRVGVLFRTDRVILEDVRMKFNEDDYAFPRPMLAARVRSLENSAYDFELGIVHLKAQLDDESAARRRAACVKIDTWIKEEQVAKADEDVVVIGDFNDKLTDPQQWNVFGPLLAPADGGFLTLPLEQAGGFTYIPFDSFIDHVHVRGAALHASSSAEVLPAEQMITGYETSVSDHRPVFATLRFAEVSP